MWRESQSIGEFALVNVLVLRDVFVDAVLPRAARRPPEEALRLLEHPWAHAGVGGNTGSSVEFIRISNRQRSPLHHHSINTLDGSVTLLLLGVVHEGTLMLQQHFDAVDRPGSAEELVEFHVGHSGSQESNPNRKKIRFDWIPRWRRG